MSAICLLEGFLFKKWGYCADKTIIGKGFGSGQLFRQTPFLLRVISNFEVTLFFAWSPILTNQKVHDLGYHEHSRENVL